MSLSDIVAKIEKKFGKDAVADLDERVEFISSGSLVLDRILGGGFAVGRLVELTSWESGSKSTVAMTFCAEVQKSGRAVGYLDTENAMDLHYAKALGLSLDPDKFLLSQTNTAEDAIEILRAMVSSGEMGVVVVDSIPALAPRAVEQGEAGDQKMGLLARLMSTWLPTLLQEARKNNCTIMFISQYREKIGVMFGDTKSTPGGNSIKYYTSQRLELQKAGFEKDGDVFLANKVRAKTIKNKVYIPQQIGEFLVVFGKGIDKLQEMMDLGVSFKVIEKKGSWYSYGDVRLGQGSSNSIELLEDNPELVEEIRGKIVVEIQNEIKTNKRM